MVFNSAEAELVGVRPAVPSPCRSAPVRLTRSAPSHPSAAQGTGSLGTGGIGTNNVRHGSSSECCEYFQEYPRNIERTRNGVSAFVSCCIPSNAHRAQLVAHVLGKDGRKIPLGVARAGRRRKAPNTPEIHAPLSNCCPKALRSWGAFFVPQLFVGTVYRTGIVPRWVPLLGGSGNSLRAR